MVLWFFEFGVGSNCADAVGLEHVGGLYFNYILYWLLLSYECDLGG